MGTLRIHFTADDLARTTLAATSDPLWEVVLSHFRLRERSRRPVFRSWTDAIRSRPERMAPLKTGARLLDVLAPMGPYWPDFLTPHESKDGLDSGLDALMSTPRARLRDELERLAQHRRLPGWVGSIAAGDAEMLTRVGAAIRSYYGAAIAPHHSLIHSAVAADHAQRARDLLEHGTEGLLTGMSTLMRWQSPVLEVSYDLDAELHLQGRGLKLVPSYFCQRAPVALADPELPPVLIYPVEQRYRWTTATAAGRAVEALLGRTRAAVLSSLAMSGTTTTELARTLQISPASASRQTTVLREAGLIVTVRDGTSVLHTITPLGVALLEGRPLLNTP
ncbi:ArsR/SmtB family transcription factor [Nonomuraea sp. H19]|uniref:ArsR/SmtB family transcription factor n=1 Tax=Nonomuraea sp. H19 TaxID=3452206 RepID=UPI003F88C48B